jgi:hypothetical protein
MLELTVETLVSEAFRGGITGIARAPAIIP